MTKDEAARATALGIYTLTPLHCGTGQATGAVDLPIARERHTRLPIVPSTSLKGCLRDAFENAEGAKDSKNVKALFGPELRLDQDDADLHAGGLIFTEGKLLAFPVPSLSAPFLYVTSRLVVDRLRSDLRAFGRLDLWPKALADLALEPLGAEEVHVATEALDGKTLVLDDLVFGAATVHRRPWVAEIAGLFAALIPEDEKGPRGRLPQALVIVADEVFRYLVENATPVQARTRLTEGKTTSKYKRADGTEDTSGNLWYEETLPADCLFSAFLLPRRERRPDGSSGSAGDPITALPKLLSCIRERSYLQVGGNETVGHGVCRFGVATEVSK
jgi:CRISPR-associated protein Cmr4